MTKVRDRKKRIYVALSGGVDSSVAILSLKKQGHNVRGVYMRTWSPPDQPCPWKEDRKSAIRVCAQLNVPFLEWDFRKEYEKEVVDHMVAEYRNGNTPNPDVICNKEIKFGLFFKRAMEDGADYVATGHYARIRKSPTSGRFFLERARAIEKDQSYFLWTLKQEHLSRTIFPVGDFESKEEVRDYARNNEISTAERKDSQGVCFIGPINVGDFLRKRIAINPGPVVTVGGKKVGEHDGLPFYTIGQRHGIGIGGGRPYYVAEKISTTNTIVVAPPAEEKLLMSKDLLASSVNWIDERPNSGSSIGVQIRYRQKPVQAVIKNLESKIRLEFDKPIRAVTPGQSVVFYEGDKVLGGGIIDDR